MVSSKVFKLNNDEYKETGVKFEKDLCEYLTMVNKYIEDKPLDIVIPTCAMKKAIIS